MFVNEFVIIVSGIISLATIAKIICCQIFANKIDPGHKWGTYCERKVSVFLFGGLIGVTFGAEQLRFEPTAGVELSNGSR